MGDRGSGVEEVQFEPFECDALEIGLHEGDFSMAHPKCPGVIGEVQFAFNQEGPEFARVSTIKLIRFMDFGFGNRDKGGIMSGMGKVLDGVCELRHGILRFACSQGLGHHPWSLDC